MNFSAVLKDFRTGKDMEQPTMVADAEPKPLTLGMCCSEALMFPDQNEKGADKKIEAFVLATKVFAGGELEITTEEATWLKQKVSVAYPSPLVSGQCAQLLNG